MKPTIKLSGVLYFLLQITQIPSGRGELLQINVQNQVIDKHQFQSHSRALCLIFPRRGRFVMFSFRATKFSFSNFQPFWDLPSGIKKSKEQIICKCCEIKRVGNSTHKRDKTHTIKHSNISAARKL